jgi:hypothetical protein
METTRLRHKERFEMSAELGSVQVRTIFESRDSPEHSAPRCTLLSVLDWFALLSSCILRA